MFFTFRQLKATNVQWTDPAATVFAGAPAHLGDFGDMKDWAEALNELDVWVNLSAVTTVASNLETYVASVVSLAIDSDRSVLIGAPARSIDGAYVLKHRTARAPHLGGHVESCTKGDWSSRLAAFERLFGPAPADMRSRHSALEEMRGIRNRFGHAFGRDIEASRQHGHISIAPMEKVSRETVVRLRDAAWQFAKSMDSFLLKEHIGDFEALNFYSTMFPSQLAHVASEQRAVNFKKAIGQFGAGLRGKAYCKGLVRYWEAL